ncbi:hypothetical protein RN2511_002350 [Rhodococcus sp. NKCM2511]|nr:hypothetical protein RN2511_002350 [Rhodococcus sp. NKCM2511]
MFGVALVVCSESGAAGETVSARLLPNSHCVSSHDCRSLALGHLPRAVGHAGSFLATDRSWENRLTRTSATDAHADGPGSEIAPGSRRACAYYRRW